MSSILLLAATDRPGNRCVGALEQELTDANAVAERLTRECNVDITLCLPDTNDIAQVHKYSTRPSIQEIDMDASNGGAFLGVYAQHTDGLILAWDTIGEGRPRNVDDTPRFGLNRMVLMRHDTPTRRST